MDEADKRCIALELDCVMIIRKSSGHVKVEKENEIMRFFKKTDTGG
jgi:hypothetical protein